MKPSAGRFTAWFSAVERQALEHEARHEDASVNWVVRKAVRSYLGRAKLLQAAQELDANVTRVMGNNQ